MPTESYLGRREVFHVSQIEQLEADKSRLKALLDEATEAISRQKLEIAKLNEDKAALTVRLNDANEEIHRLNMVVRRQLELDESMLRQGPDI